VWEPPKLKAKAKEAKNKAHAIGLARHQVSNTSAAGPGNYSPAKQDGSYHTLAGLSVQDLMQTASSGFDFNMNGGYHEAKDSFTGGDGFDGPQSSDPESVFRRFRMKLHAAQMKWQTVRNPANVSSIAATTAKVGFTIDLDRFVGSYFFKHLSNVVAGGARIPWDTTQFCCCQC
jgi:hypothetical protein